MPQIEISHDLYEKLKLAANHDDTTIESIIENQIEDASFESNLSKQLDVISLVADGVVTVDANQRIVAFNSGAENLFNYQENDVLGEHLNILIPEHARSYHPDNVNEFIASNSKSRYMANRQSLQARRKDGSHFNADISITRYKVRNVDYFIAIIRDVTETSKLIERLEVNEAHLRLMTDNATDIICLHSPDGTYEFVSKSSQQIMGFEPEELLGKTPYDFFHPDDIQSIQETHQRSVAGDSDTRITYRFRTKSGKYIWFETITKPILDDNNEVTNLVTVSRNVSEQVDAELALKMERDFIQGIMDMSPSAIIVVTNNGKITLANKRAEEVLGLRKDGITARTYDAPDWKHTDYDGNPWPDEKQPFVRVMTTKAPVWDVRHAINKPDGERIFLAINGMPIFDDSGEIIQIIFTVEDYTERKIQQDELLASLEREKQLNKMKSEFLSIVSHEFKTPLSIILTSTSLMRLKHHVMQPENLLERLKRIERQVERLNQLINDVAFINKSELVGHLIIPTVINLSEFFEEIINDLKPNFPNIVDVELIKDGDRDDVLLDRQLAHFIFGNIISNAMKYSGQNGDGRVEINYSCDNTSLTALISDNGIGIPMEDQRNLFELFHRARNVGNIRGTGLGLVIVKTCLDSLDGDISFESIENEGTQIIVKIPLLPEMSDKSQEK